MPPYPIATIELLNAIDRACGWREFAYAKTLIDRHPHNVSTTKHDMSSSYVLACMYGQTNLAKWLLPHATYTNSGVTTSTSVHRDTVELLYEMCATGNLHCVRKLYNDANRKSRFTVVFDCDEMVISLAHAVVKCHANVVDFIICDMALHNNSYLIDRVYRYAKTNLDITDNDNGTKHAERALHTMIVSKFAEPHRLTAVERAVAAAADAAAKKYAADQRAKQLTADMERAAVAAAFASQGVVVPEKLKLQFRPDGDGKLQVVVPATLEFHDKKMWLRDACRFDHTATVKWLVKTYGCTRKDYRRTCLYVVRHNKDSAALAWLRGHHTGCDRK